ncbi:DUF2153 family protein [Pyrobaculum aerophilum]|uniref:DUF2153 domain-containing protein n=2 Tax=Pyrobaculum aerophilum TaxID=13773 RepID=Q8ZX35_PYRAE|nr:MULTISPECIES: DUF2153 family protein [Pyrobaculum]AAL63514.1 conserved hypothetical protein [Pyrobaculum aerophilum str. IM2]MCX8135983.1 DUF2153 family protein [Pyrobaculum aerophilum]RFA94609.1 DUF2153 domain-containing protein [Pyrobaculum aerophilum]RFB00272.1 DUF2153 domain-containing protein [Pyrobaculum aerophilum]HII46382.1 DUF2153 family protein [Pyrobaculum aerophilum]
MSRETPTTEAVLEYLESMMERLEQWVKEQERQVKELESHGEHMKVADRLELLYSAQAMLGYIARVLKDFESWLNNPVVTSVMPEEMLRRLESMLREVAIKFIQVDIAHTSEYKELLSKFAREGKVPSVLMLYIQQRPQAPARRRGGEEGGTPRFF